MNKSILLAGLLGLAALPAGPAAAQDKPGSTAAPFLLLGVDARGNALGGAQVAFAEGPAALHWNPAGIASATARPGTGSALFSSSNWLVGSRHNYAGATFNAGGLGTFGLSVTQLDYGEEPVTTIENPDGTGELYGAQDLAVGVTYARALTERFTVGGTAKLVRQQIWNESATGGALDLGVRYRTDFRGLTIGMTMANFGTDMRLAGRDLRRRIDIAPDQSGNNPDLPANLEVNAWPMPLEFRVGVAAEAFRLGDQRLIVSAEGLAPSDNSQSASFGAEYGFRDLLYVRAGYRQAFSSVASDGGWAAGFGLRYDLDARLGLRVDYVFQEYEPFGTPQMFTFGVTF
ncbi:MAG: PorV/PorQ family protein [Rubricoccaceae bacterium]